MTGLRIALFFADGRAFLVANLVLMACLLALASANRKRLIALGRLGMVVAVLGIGLSSPALPPWFLAIWVWVTLAWLVLDRLRRLKKQTVSALVAVPLGLCLAALAMELPRWRLPKFEVLPCQRICILGDSLSAGMGTGETTWPKLLAKSLGIEVIDLSAAGATTASARQQARGIPPGEAVVVLEIGGNDLLGNTSIDTFEADLRTLLTSVGGPSRHLVMFELPLPPLSGGYGRVQRRLAAEFDVMLLPRRVLAGVIGASDTTLDGLHLSDQGHRAVAAVLIQVLGIPPTPSGAPS